MTPEGDYYAGAVAVVFVSFEAAQACAKAMHGRFFDGRQIDVELQGKVEAEKVEGSRIEGREGGGEEGGEGGGVEGEDVESFLKSLEG